MGLLDGKVAIITGGGRGLGRAVATLFADEGAAVVINARSKRDLDETRAALETRGHRVVAVAGDVGDPATAPQLLEVALDTFSACDVLVNAAAIAKPVGEVETFDVAEWTEHFRVNVTGTFLTCRAMIPEMKRRQQGRIVNVATGLVTFIQPGQSAYSASNAAVVQFSRVVASEVADFGIKVNVVHPGIVRTPMLEFLSTVPGEGARASIVKRIRSLGETGKILEPEQSARLFLWMSATCDKNGEFIRMDDPAVRAAVDGMRPL